MNCSSSCIGKLIFCPLLVQDLCTYQLVCAAQPCQVIDDEPLAQGLRQHMTFCKSAKATIDKAWKHWVSIYKQTHLFPCGFT